MLLSSSLAQASVYASIGGALTEGSLRYSQVNSSMTQTVGQINGTGQLGIGYADRWGDFFWGIETGVEFQGFNAEKVTHVNGSNHPGTAILSTRLKDDYYFHFKPGYIVNHAFAFYALIGVLAGEFSYSDVTGDIGNIPGPTYDETRIGYRAGLGMSNLVEDHWEFRFEYTYNGYASIDSTLDDQHSGLPVDYTRSNITLSQLLFGVAYYF
jgi:opacity protein-like surface antigen